MADEGFKRKLAANISADVEGYSRQTTIFNNTADLDVFLILCEEQAYQSIHHQKHQMKQ